MTVPAAEDDRAEGKEEAIKKTIDLTWCVLFTSLHPDSAFELLVEDQWMLMQINESLVPPDLCRHRVKAVHSTSGAGFAFAAVGNHGRHYI